MTHSNCCLLIVIATNTTCADAATAATAIAAKKASRQKKGERKREGERIFSCPVIEIVGLIPDEMTRLYFINHERKGKRVEHSKRERKQIEDS